MKFESSPGDDSEFIDTNSELSDTSMPDISSLADTGASNSIAPVLPTPNPDVTSPIATTRTLDFNIKPPTKKRKSNSGYSRRINSEAGDSSILSRKSKAEIEATKKEVQAIKTELTLLTDTMSLLATTLDKLFLHRVPTSKTAAATNPIPSNQSGENAKINRHIDHLGVADPCTDNQDSVTNESKTPITMNEEIKNLTNIANIHAEGQSKLQQIKSRLNWLTTLPDQTAVHSGSEWITSKKGKHGRSAPIPTPPTNGMQIALPNNFGEAGSAGQVGKAVKPPTPAKQTPAKQQVTPQELLAPTEIASGGYTPPNKEKAGQKHQNATKSNHDQQTGGHSSSLRSANHLPRTATMTPGIQGRSFADVVKKSRKFAPSPRQLSAMIRPKPEPMQFERIHLLLENGRILKGKSTATRNRTIKSLLKYMGIKNKVVLWSLVGNSFVEIYVAVASVNTVLENIELRGGTALQNPDIWMTPVFMDATKFEKATFARINWQTKQSRFINLTNCIRQGMPDDIPSLTTTLQIVDEMALDCPVIDSTEISITPPDVNMEYTNLSEAAVGTLPTELPNVEERATAPTQC
jgi:hypothetical protein